MLNWKQIRADSLFMLLIFYHSSPIRRALFFCFGNKANSAALDCGEGLWPLERLQAAFFCGFSVASTQHEKAKEQVPQVNSVSPVASNQSTYFLFPCGYYKDLGRRLIVFFANLV